MPSSKKSRGKQRKIRKELQGLKKAAAAPNAASPSTTNVTPNQDEEPWSRRIQTMEWSTSSNCRHGTPSPLPSGVWKIKDAFFGELEAKKGCQAPGFFAVIGTLLQEYPMLRRGYQKVDPHDETRDLFIKFLESLGTELILMPTGTSAEKEKERLLVASCMAQALVAFDHVHEAVRNLDVHTKMMQKLRDLRDDDRKRTLTRFFARRISCDCLLELKKEVTQVQKTGLCYNCWQRFHIKDLKLCSKCKIAHYCSSQCQKADWPIHKNGGCIFQRFLPLKKCEASSKDEEEHNVDFVD